MARLRVLCAAALLLALPLQQRASMLIDLEQGIQQLPLMCPVPLREEVAVTETDAGRLFGSLARGQLRQLQAAQERMCRRICGATFPTSTGALDLKAHCESTCTDVKPEMAERCGRGGRELCEETVKPGEFCVWFDQKLPNGTVSHCYVTKNSDTALSQECPAGFHCLGGHHAPRPCAKGRYCPSGSVESLACPRGHMCTFPAFIYRCSAELHPFLSGTMCDSSSNKKGISILPQPCKMGFFCPNGIPELCPPGHFCPEGSSSPFPCKFGEFCQEGLTMPTRGYSSFCWGGLGLCGYLLLSSCLKNNFTGMMLMLQLILAALALVGFWTFDGLLGAGSHTVLISIEALLLPWGLFISPRMSRVTGCTATQQLWVDILSLIAALSIVIWTVEPADRQAHAMFLSAVLVSTWVSYHILVDNLMMMPALVVVLASVTALLLGLPYLTGIQELGVVGLRLVVVLLMVLVEAVRYGSYRCREGAQQQHNRQILQQEVERKRNSGRGTLFPAAVQRLVAGAGSVGRRSSWGGRSLQARTEEAGAVELAPAHKEEPQETPSQESPSRPMVSVSLRRMSLFLPNGQTILNSISLHVPAGSSVAIMGPSGSGKSSIANVLSGRAGYGMVTGELLVNGRVDISPDQLRRITGFVPQEDVMHRSLTCFENVAFAAALRMPRAARRLEDGSHWAAAEARRMLELLGIDSTTANTLIGDESSRGVSGGQRKRVSIGMELISRPSLLFLDEPTSGLDSTTAHVVTQLVSRSSKSLGCTAAAVIHQPRFETFMLFDHVFLLASGGYLVYAGPTKKVAEYFTTVLGVSFSPNSNPADIFMDMVSYDTQAALSSGSLSDQARRGSEFFGTFLASEWDTYSSRYAVPPEETCQALPDTSPECCTWGEAMLTNVKRAGLQNGRSVGQQLFVAFITGTGTWAISYAMPAYDVEKAVLQPAMVLLFLMVLQSIAAQRVFGGAERFVAWREASVGVNMLVYFTGRDLAALVEIALSSTAFTSVYWACSNVLMSYHHMFWTVFSCIYAVWGLNFIWSIALPPGLSQLCGVVVAFLSFLLIGLEPPFATLSQFPSIMAPSPLRWTFGSMMWSTIDRTLGASMSNNLIEEIVSARLWTLGMPLGWIKETGWSCAANELSVRERWLGHRALGPSWRAPISFVCGPMHVILLGLYYRFVAAILLIAISKLHATGGGAVVQGAYNGKKVTSFLGRLVVVLFVAFIFALTCFELDNIMSFVGQ